MGEISDAKRERPERIGQRTLAAFVDAETHRAFKVLAAELGTTSVALMHEAISLVLARHGKAVPTAAVEHLKAHGRPLPNARLKANGRHHG